MNKYLKRKIILEPDIQLDNTANNESGTNESEKIFAGGSNDFIRGLDGEDTIYGQGGDDDLFGNQGNDTLFGGNQGDELEGGDGDDLLYGENGADNLKGQKGFNTLIGGPGNDTLSGLGELKNRFFDDILGNPPGVDTYEGGTGADTFNLKRASDDEGRLFVKGQKYAVIKDFNVNENDIIKLPGSPDDYDAQITGENNEDTALFYTEDPDIDISLGIGGISVGSGLALDVPNQTALVAIIEGATIRDVTSPDFYEYKGVG